MAYAYTNARGRTYSLHRERRHHDRTGAPYWLHYFASEKRENAAAAFPEGCRVIEGKSGMPMLEKIEDEDA